MQARLQPALSAPEQVAISCVGVAEYHIEAETWCEGAEGLQLQNMQICIVGLSHTKVLTVMSRLRWDCTQTSGGGARADLVKFWILSRLSSTERAKARLWENQARRCSMGLQTICAFPLCGIVCDMLLLLHAGLQSSRKHLTI